MIKVLALLAVATVIAIKLSFTMCSYTKPRWLFWAVLITACALIGATAGVVSIIIRQAIG